MQNFRGNTHLIMGSEADIPRVLALLEKTGVAIAANPDLYVRSYKNFGIDDAHELRGRASSRSIGEGVRVFVVSASGMTTEAQNALLKTFEEPPADAAFFFIVPAPQMLLSTVRSRSQVMHLAIEKNNKKEQGKEKGDASAFLAAAPAKRIEMLKPILEKGDDDKYDTGALLAFLNSLEMEIAAVKNKALIPDALHAIYRARMYITDRGALVKPLLESVALLCPVV